AVGFLDNNRSADDPDETDAVVVVDICVIRFICGSSCSCGELRHWTARRALAAESTLRATRVAHLRNYIGGPGRGAHKPLILEARPAKVEEQRAPNVRRGEVVDDLRLL